MPLIAPADRVRVDQPFGLVRRPGRVVDSKPFDLAQAAGPDGLFTDVPNKRNQLRIQLVGATRLARFDPYV